MSNYGVANSSSPSSFIEFNDQLYFSANDGESGREIFVSDGTAEGTQLLVDLNPGFYDNNYGPPIPKSFNPNNFIEFNNKLYFSANDGENGNELFVSDGTAEGTQLLVDLNPGLSDYGFANSSNPSSLVEFNGKLYFSADDGESGRELFVSDGTAEGTQLLVDLNSGVDDSNYGSPLPAGSNPGSLVELNGKLYFSANDGESGNNLFVSDGTAEGTQLLVDLSPSSSYDYNFEPNPYEPFDLVKFENKLYFAANGESGNELFVTDGTRDGTQLVADINIGSGGSYPSGFSVVGDELFFSANNGQIGTELYKLTLEDDTAVEMVGNEENNTLLGSDRAENIEGRGGDDILFGDSGNDFLVGGDGNDSLGGGTGNDTLNGGIGDDFLVGGTGNDILDGGIGFDTLFGDAGEDVFVLRAGDGTDTIVNFELGIDSFGLADGLEFGSLDLSSGNDIKLGTEVLATLNRINTAELTADNFRTI